MKREFGTEAKDLVCAIGPSICQDCYEVSEDVADALKRRSRGMQMRSCSIRKWQVPA